MLLTTLIIRCEGAKLLFYEFKTWIYIPTWKKGTTPFVMDVGRRHVYRALILLYKRTFILLLTLKNSESYNREERSWIRNIEVVDYWRFKNLSVVPLEQSDFQKNCLWTKICELSSFHKDKNEWMNFYLCSYNPILITNFLLYFIFHCFYL